MNVENKELEDTLSSSNESNPSNPETQDQTVVPGEFKISTRKLEMPVRPRGVLAE